MNAKQVAKRIRKQIKEKTGATARQVSVRSRATGWSEAIDIVRRDPSVDRAVLLRIAEEHKQVRTDDQGNVLRGLNLYISVSG